MAVHILALFVVALPAARANPSVVASASSAFDPADPELATIKEKVSEYRRQLGERAGVPDSPEQYQPAPADARWLTSAEARRAFSRANPELEKIRWWKVPLDPATLPHALREPAAVISGCVAAKRAGLDDADRSVAIAQNAAEFLLWAQAQAGTGGFPFPSARSVGGNRAFVASERFLAKAEREGRLHQILRNGWIIDDADDGGLQFDNAEAGAALLELHELTADKRYLDSALKAADWAAARPLVANWNYNSFSVHLLAKTYQVTGQQKYLTAATRKGLIGVVPGQLTDGAKAGRWFDPHNARPEYHYIMLRGLTQLAAVMPKDDPAWPELRRSLQLGLRARNLDLLGPGAPTKNKAMEALLLVNRVFADDKEFLRDTLSAEALDVLGKLVSNQYLQGRDPLGPREWGQLLEFVIAKERAAANP